MLVAPLLTSLSCCLIFAFSLARFRWNSSSTLKDNQYQCFLHKLRHLIFFGLPIKVSYSLHQYIGTILISKSHLLMASSSVLLCCSFKSASFESFSANRRRSSWRTVDWNVNRLPRPLLATTRCCENMSFSIVRLFILLVLEFCFQNFKSLVTDVEYFCSIRLLIIMLCSSILWTELSSMAIMTGTAAE